jgi:subtilisin-like proprotein convertase family protein
VNKLLIASGLAVLAASANAIVYDIDAGGPVNDVSTNNFLITIAGSPITSITDVNVRLNITHTFDADMDISLISPGGTVTLDLSSDNGGSGDNYRVTLLDDSAATAVTAGVAPFNGSFRPEAALSALNGLDANGVWTLRIVDDLGGDVGWAWRTGDVEATGATITEGCALIIEGVPEPATFLAVGAGLLPLALRRRLKK